MTANVVQLKPATISNADIYFPVSMHPIKALRGDNPFTRMSNVFQAVVRDDTEEIIAVHRDRYKLVSNAEIFPKFESAIRTSRLDTKGMQVVDELSHNGARAFRTYRFPQHQVEIRKGDLVSLELKVVNSYDGAFAFQSILGAFRLICSNGMVIGQTFNKTYGKHTAGLDIDSAASRIHHSLQVFLSNTQNWKQWADRQIDDITAEHLIAVMPGMNEKAAGLINGFWQTEKVENGPTLWALFNALTYWSTHADIRAASIANRPSIVVEREARVRSVVQHPEWLKAAA